MLAFVSLALRRKVATMTANKKAAPGRTGTASNTALASNHSINKIDRVRNVLALPKGLNRFEAERLGDHTLNSTVSALRKRGEVVSCEWETVPTRHCSDGVRVKRYWIAGGGR